MIRCCASVLIDDATRGHPESNAAQVVRRRGGSAREDAGGVEWESEGEAVEPRRGAPWSQDKGAQVTLRDLCEKGDLSHPIEAFTAASVGSAFRSGAVALFCLALLGLPLWCEGACSDV